MARRLEKLRRLLRRREDVQEGAACTRALVGILGENSIDNWMQTVQLSQGMLTARIWQSQINVPMPRSLAKQLDPMDPAFWPPSAIMMSLFARERTVLSDGSTNSSRAYVDPWGWFHPLQSPALTVWCSDGEQWYCPGKLPLSTEENSIEQRMTQDGHGVETIVQCGKLQLELFHWPSSSGRGNKGRLSWNMVFRVRALEACEAQMALVLRPIELDGAFPIFQLARDATGTWVVDGTPYVVTEPGGAGVLTSVYGQPDLWKQCSTGTEKERYSGEKILQRTCSVGQCSGAELYRASLQKGEVLSAIAIVHPSKAVHHLRRSTPKNLWSGSVQDRRDVLSMGAQIELTAHQALFERVQLRLLSETGELGLEGCLAALALARLGFVQIAATRLDEWMQNVDVEAIAENEEIAILVWAVTEFALWTRERSWVQDKIPTLLRLLDGLSSQKCGAGGQTFFGTEGSHRWSEIWRVAALLNGVRALRSLSVHYQHWAVAGASAQEQLLTVLGSAPWAPSESMAPDGASAALLAAGWLGVVPLDTPALQETHSFVSTVMQHDGGVLSMGGAHIAKTGLWLALNRQYDPNVDAVSTIAKFASSTGALPTIRHQSKGVLGEGDSLLSAAIFAFMVLDELRMSKEELKVGALIRSAHELPTPIGKIDIMDGVIQNRTVRR